MDTDEILKILDELGQRLTPAGKYVFELAIRQQVIDGVYSLVVGITFIVIGLALYRWGSRNNKDWEIPSPANLSMIAGPVILGIAVIFLLTSEFATKIFNPEYAALRDLIKTLTGNGR